MSVTTEIIDLMSRSKVHANALNAQQIERIELYARGIESKLLQVFYALMKISESSTKQPDFIDSDGFSYKDRMNFFTDSFLTFSRSVLDILAQLINQTQNIGMNENSCDFLKLCNEMKSNYPQNNITGLIDNIFTNNLYREMNDYRNCSIHRRQVYLECQKTVVLYTTPGYSTSSTANLITNTWFICDNPLDVHPSINFKRDLINYCQNIYDQVENWIINILKVLLI